MDPTTTNNNNNNADDMDENETSNKCCTIFFSLILLILLPLEPLFYGLHRLYQIMPELNFFHSQRGKYIMLCCFIITITGIFDALLFRFKFKKDLNINISESTQEILFLIFLIILIISFIIIPFLIAYNPKEQGGKCPAIFQSIAILMILAFFNGITIIILGIYGLICFFKHGIMYPASITHEFVIQLWEIIILRQTTHNDDVENLSQQDIHMNHDQQR